MLILLFQTLAFSGFRSGLTAQWAGLILSVTTTGPETQLPIPVAQGPRQPTDANAIGCRVPVPLTQMSSSDVFAKQIKLKDNIALSSTLQEVLKQLLNSRER